jgi:hypothetical protein
MTPDSFSKLACRAALEKYGDLPINRQAAALGLAIKTWMDIRSNEFGDLKEASNKKRRSMIGVVARVCDGLDLDLESCLKACDLPHDENAVALGLKSHSPILLGKEELAALNALVEAAGNPIPIPFAVEFLSLRRK